MTEGSTAEFEKTGRWQVALLVLVGCNYVIVSINHVLPSFHGFTPPYYCEVEEGDNITRVEGCLVDQECERGYHFESPRDETTIVSEWGLVCEQRLLKPLIATLYYCGVMVGAPVGGMMADKYGRRLVMLVSLYFQGALGIALCFANTLVLFTVIRFIQGIFVQSLQGSTYTLLMELFPTKSRTAVGIVLEIYWALGLCILAGCSYFIPNWRSLQLALTLLTLLTLPYACFIPESPRWLATCGRHVEADRVLQTISRLNGFTQSDVDSKQKQHKNAYILPDSTKSSFEKNGFTPSSPKTTNAVIVDFKVKDNIIHSSVSETSSCFKEVLPENKTNVTNKEELPPTELNTPTSSDTKRTSCNGSASAGVSTKQDNECSVANGVRTVETVKSAKETKGSVLDLVRNSLMRKYSGLMIYIWFSVSLSYYGIIFYLPALSGDRHLNFFLGAIPEAVSYCIAYFVLSRFGRRFPLVVYLLLSGLLCAVVGILGSLQTDSLATLQTVLALLGKATVVSSFCTIFIYTAELFPTVVRAVAMGCCTFGGRIGNLLAPQLLLLGEFTTNAVPLISMGVLAMVAGVVTLLLPETLGRPLSNTVQQAVEMDKHNRRRKSSVTGQDC